MILRELLDGLSSRVPPLVTADHNIDLLLARIDAGWTPVVAEGLPAGPGSVPGPCLLIQLAVPGGLTRESVLVSLGPRAQALLRARMPGLGITSAPGLMPAPTSNEVGLELKALLEATQELSPQRRGERLADFILERIDCSRCAIVPVDAGAFGEPVAFRLRGEADRIGDPRHVPRGVLQRVARTRQPVINHDATTGRRDLLPTDTVVRQRIRSYMAVPVVLRDDLLAVAYIDRLEKAGPFSVDEQASFQAFAYELARPILEARLERREDDLVMLRDAALAGRVAVLAPPMSAALSDVVARARDLAPHASESLLLLGETGVGKEWLARLIHDASGRRGRFVAVNLAAIPTELFESELMGSARGAFTGSVEREGLVAAAEGGTLFLDEIGDLDLASQVRLLRFVQERTVRLVGSREERMVDVRLLAATNRDVTTMVRQGTFRADLLHRFAPPLVVPPLRERREEILPLAEAWLGTRAAARGVPAPELADDARKLISCYSWPGNVRQIQVVLSHAALLSQGPITAELLESLLGEPAPTPAASAGAPQTWQEYSSQRDAAEREWLESVLNLHGGRVEAAARAIACPASTLRAALRRHGIGRK